MIFASFSVEKKNKRVQRIFRVRLPRSLVLKSICLLLACLLAWSASGFNMCTQTKAAALMANIQQADIDPTGVFKYVLIRVHSKEEGDDSEVDIVRGYGWAEYHGESGASRRAVHSDSVLASTATCWHL